MHLRDYSKRSPLEVWYERLDSQQIIDMAPDAKAKALREQVASKARKRVGEYLFPRIATSVGGRHRLVDQPPVLFHITDPDRMERAHEALEGYRSSLPDERRDLLDRYRLEDVAMKIVGIGSVGTRCYVGLYSSADRHPLLLQFKEACASVLEPYAGKSVYKNHGERVVMGQRRMQSSSDIFLGWTRGRLGYDFFGRQLRDMKMSFPVEGASAVQHLRYGEVCGLTLARAHAKCGDAALISGYLGKLDVFDKAIGRFAVAYADQTEKDHAALVAAVKAERVEALVEEDL